MGKEGDLASERPLSQLLEALMKMHHTGEREEERERSSYGRVSSMHPHPSLSSVTVLEKVSAYTQIKKDEEHSSKN